MTRTSTPRLTAWANASIASGSGMKYGFWIHRRSRAQQIIVWCRIFTAGAEPSGFRLAMCASTSPAGSKGGNTSAPTKSFPVTSTQFSLKADCTA